MTSLMPELVPGPVFWVMLLFLAAIGTPFLITGKRLLRNPSRRVRELVAYPVLVIGSIALGTSVTMFAAWVGLWLWFIGMLLWPAHIR